VKIMAARVGLTPAQYRPLLAGTKLLTLKEAKAAFKKGPKLSSVYGSSKVADDFNVANGVYKKHQDVDAYIDPSMTESMK
jgi:NitT/TauT family transport system substrate-binding protein